MVERGAHGSATPIRVFLLDDHEIARRGIRELLGAVLVVVRVDERADELELIWGWIRHGSNLCSLDTS